MKGLAKKKIAIGILSIGIVASLGFSIYTSLSMRNAEGIPKADKTEVNQVNKQKEEKPNEEESVILNPLNGKDDPMLSDGKEELNRSEIKVKEQEVRRLFRQFKFTEGTEMLERMKRKNSFTGEAKILEKLYYDGSLIMTLEPLDGNDHHEEVGEGVANDRGVINVVKAIKDPESLLLAVLYLNNELRAKTILYDGSLNPVFGKIDEIRITQKTTLKEIPREIKIMYPEVTTVHKISFILEGFSLDAYIHEEQNGNLHFYKIDDPNNKSHYYTIVQWKKIRANLNAGRPAMKGVLDEVTETPSEQDREGIIETTTP